MEHQLYNVLTFLKEPMRKYKFVRKYLVLELIMLVVDSFLSYLRDHQDLPYRNLESFLF
jgi:hypothetical protein